MRVDKSEIKGKCLTFKIGPALFGIPAVKVRGIFMAPQLTKVPLAPDGVRGVASFHGAIAPFVDLAARLGLETENMTGVRLCAIAINIHNDDDTPDIAVLVDEVADMASVSEEDILDVPGRDAPHILAVARAAGSEIQILDVERLFPLKLENGAR